MLQNVLMVIAVFLMVFGIISSISKIVEACLNKEDTKLWLDMIIISIGLSYLIWYCN